MPDTADDLRRGAQQDRDHADDIADDNPTAAEYFELRASWKEHLARERERFDAAP